MRGTSLNQDPMKRILAKQAQIWMPLSYSQFIEGVHIQHHVWQNKQQSPFHFSRSINPVSVASGQEKEHFSAWLCGGDTVNSGLTLSYDRSGRQPFSKFTSRAQP